MRLEEEFFLPITSLKLVNFCNNSFISLVANVFSDMFVKMKIEKSLLVWE